MKKHALGVLTLAVGSLLTACGGGSGSSGVVRDALLDSKPMVNNNTTNNGANNNVPENGSPENGSPENNNTNTNDLNENITPPLQLKTTKYGQVIAQPKGQSVSEDMLKEIPNVSDIKTLIINGHKFSLGTVGDYAGVDKHTYNLNHVSYGLIDDYARSRMEYAYYQGNRMVDMPKSGVAKYEGGLVVSCNDELVCRNEYHSGKSSFEVNFGEKSLTGSLSALGTTLQVAGEIQGSTFSGNHQDTKISGAFFGDNAQEMAGVFYHENAKTGLEAGGAFGATKQ